jgi:glycosyltransferase involved in cell wall biosynthesis
MLVSPKDSTALANTLSCLLSDRDLIESMGKAGRQLAVQRFGVTKVIDLHYSLYHAFV